MIENAERHFPQMKDMAVHETLAETLWGFNGNRVPARDALRTYSEVTGLNLVTTRQFPEQDEVSLPRKGERYTVAEILERLLEQTEFDGVYNVHDGAVIVGARKGLNVRMYSGAWLPEWKPLWASEALSSIGAGAVPALIKLLTDERFYVRMAAVIALGEMNAPGHSTVSALAKRLADEMPLVRVLSTVALARIGPEAAEAIPPLKKATEDRNLALSVRASRALRTIQGESYLK